VRSNLVLGRPDASEQAIADALRAARLTDWVAALPQGLDTPVGEDGVAVSGGERRRLAVARALLAHGDLPGAAEHAVAAIAAAQSISFVHPLAMGLETAALVGLASGTADRADLASLLRCAADIRARGERPGIPSLAAAVRAASGQLDISSAAVLTAAESAALATDIGRRCLA